MSQSNNHTTNFKANPIQKMFIESQAKADLFSSRVGEGKSAGLTWSVFYHTRHNPGADWAIIRDTWENLRKTTLKEFFYWFPPGVFGTWHEGHKTFTWAEGVGKGTVMWLGLDDPSDASKLQSLQLAGIAMDEPAPAAQSGGIAELIFDIGFTRLRQPNMNWYGYKLATNNPDETHWTYKRFVEPGTEGFVSWQPHRPENETNLPPGYYADLRRLLAGNASLVDRFVEGKYGFAQVGQAVTPEWNDAVHLATGLAPVRGTELVLLWDFGLNPTCIITQVTPLRRWLILDSFVGESEGVEELIVRQIKSVLASKYRGYTWRHIGDPNGAMREQSSAARSAVRVLLKELGGSFRKGPKDIPERVNPLRAALRQQGLIIVDRSQAPHVWQALRGGWHYRVGNTGVVSGSPEKNQHSHPGDAMGYGAAVLFPLGRLQERPSGLLVPQTATFFGESRRGPGPTPTPGARIPPHGHSIGG